MSIVNTAKPSTSLANASKPVIFTTWASITTTWATETHTWLSVSALLGNTARVSPSITNTAKP